jgi:2-oxoisovalerate dehydrogenase E2 component (dihydrolipoyl transacylase)
MAEFVFRLPDLAEGLDAVEVVEWRVTVGDTVELNQLVAEVETSKTTVEIPSPAGGLVKSLHAEQGSLVRVGEPLITFEVPDAGDEQT